MLREDLQNALKDAMKSKNMLEVNAIRMIIAGMKEKDVDARGKGKKQAEDSELLAMMQGMIKQRNESIKLYNDGNRPDLAEKEQAEIVVIERFLPKQLSEAEMTEVIKGIIAKTGAQSIKDMGKVMTYLTDKIGTQADMSLVSKLVKSKF